MQAMLACRHRLLLGGQIFVRTFASGGPKRPASKKGLPGKGGSAGGGSKRESLQGLSLLSGLAKSKPSQTKRATSPSAAAAIAMPTQSSQDDSFKKLKEEFAKIRAAKGRGRGGAKRGPGGWGLKGAGRGGGGAPGGAGGGGGWLDGAVPGLKASYERRESPAQRAAASAARMRSAVKAARHVAHKDQATAAQAANARVQGDVAAEEDEAPGSAARGSKKPLTGRQAKQHVRAHRGNVKPTLKSVRRRLGPKASRAELQRVLKREKDRWLRRQGLKFKEVTVGEAETPVTLARGMGVKVQWVLSKLRALGESAHRDTVLDADIAEIVVQDLGMGVKRQDFEDRVPSEAPEGEEGDALPPRAPVVTVMGHVDHGKTSLLDVLRGGTRVAAGEAGGITQGISAFVVHMASPVVPLQAIEERVAPSSGKKKKKAKTAAGAGGAVGGYEGDIASMTFIDTPGHALFSSMRAQGSSSTDLAVIVVAAEDGVQPQTLESVQLCLSAGVPMVVALTKVDLHPNPDAAAERVGHQLLESGVQIEAMGGDVPLVQLSSMTGAGVGELKEALALQAELLELKAPTAALGEARVLESHQVKGLGVAADCIVTWGTLKVGDAVVVGEQAGRVKSLLDTGGARVKSMLPGFAVRVVGLASPPSAGEHILACDSDARAKEVADWRARKAAVRKSVEDSARAKATADADAERLSGLRNRVKRTESLRKRDGQRRYLTSRGEDVPLHLEEQPWEVALRAELDAEAAGGGGPGGAAPVAAELDRGRQVTVGGDAVGGPKVLPVLMRVDCSGSLDALHTALALIPDDEVRLKVVDTKVNEVSEGDVALAKDLGASILAFGVKVPGAVGRAAERAKVPIVQDRIIYSFVDKLADVLSSYLPAEKEARVTGRAVVQTVFPLNTTGGKKGPSVIAGSRVLEGSITRGGNVRVLRGDEVVYEGPALPSLQHFQDRVDKVAKGEECGIGVSNTWNEVEEGDIIEVVTWMTSRRRLTVDLHNTGAIADSSSDSE